MQVIDESFNNTIIIVVIIDVWHYITIGFYYRSAKGKHYPILSVTKQRYHFISRHFPQIGNTPLPLLNSL